MARLATKSRECPEEKVAAHGRQVFTMEAEHVAGMEGVIIGEYIYYVQ